MTALSSVSVHPYSQNSGCDINKGQAVVKLSNSVNQYYLYVIDKAPQRV